MLRKLIVFKPNLYQRRSQLLLNVDAVFFHGKYSGGQHFKANKSAVDSSACESARPNYKGLTMDDMPVPYGSWTQHYKKTNSRYNIILVFGFVSLIGSLFILKESMFFNAFPPPYPFSEEDDKCKCE